MTVPAQSTLFNESTANGLTTSFPYEFKIASADDITVELNGVAQTTGFTVTGVGEDVGGSVVFSVAPANGVTVLRYLDPVFNREENYPQFGDFNASIVNLDFDRLWLAMQSILANVRRAIKLPVATSVDQTAIGNAAARANKGLKFDGSGNIILSTYDPDAAQTAGSEAVSAASTASAAAVAAAASAASIPSMTGGADTVLVINPTNDGWLYKTATQMRTFLGLGSAALSNTSAFQAADADIPTVSASQVEMESGTEPALRSMSPLRVAQAIAALSSSFDPTYFTTPSVLSNSSVQSMAHSLGAVPKHFSTKLLVTTANNGWSVGDVIEGTGITLGGVGNDIVLVGADATNIVVVCSTGDMTLLNKSTGAAATSAVGNFKVIVGVSL